MIYHEEDNQEFSLTEKCIHYGISFLGFAAAFVIVALAIFGTAL